MIIAFVYARGYQYIEKTLHSELNINSSNEAQLVYNQYANVMYFKHVTHLPHLRYRFDLEPQNYSRSNKLNHSF